MLRPNAWIDSIRVEREVRAYPLYAVPYPGSPVALSREDGNKNYERFLETKADRLHNLRELLQRPQSKLEANVASLSDLDAWCHRYGGHLVATGPLRSELAFRNFVPAWHGKYAGLNIVWDIAIFVGEACLSKNPACRWFLYDEHGGPQKKDDPAYLRPCLAIPRKPGYWDLFTTIHSIMIAKRRLITVGATSVPGFLDYAPDTIEKQVRFCLST